MAPQERHPHGQVTTHVEGERVLHITIDRVEKRNAFTPKIIVELAESLTLLEETTDLWVGVISFAGEHSTGGLDMPLFFGDGSGGFRRDPALVDPFAMGRRSSKPIITAVQGITYTAGIELAIAGDIVVAGDDARFAQLEPRRGLAPIGGATFRFVERGGWGNAMYHLLRADEFDAAEALRVGLVQEVVPAGTQVERALELGAEIAAQAPLAVQGILANARKFVENGEWAAIEDLKEMDRRIQSSADIAEGVASFIERRDARFEGR